MAVEFRIKNKREVEAFFRKVERIPMGTQELMHTAGLYYEREVHKTFRTSGRNIGKPWRTLARDTVFTKMGTKRIRYGTDRPPKRNRKALNAYKESLMESGKLKVGQIGPLPGYEGHRRYKSNLDKPLIASGDFMKSWQLLRWDANRAIIGSTFPDRLSQWIIRRRPVVVVTRRMRREFNKILRAWIKKRMR